MEVTDIGKTLDTYGITKITAVESFIVQAPGANVLEKTTKNM
jgi:hypothetical protein